MACKIFTTDLTKEPYAESYRIEHSLGRGWCSERGAGLRIYRKVSAPSLPLTHSEPWISSLTFLGLRDHQHKREFGAFLFWNALILWCSCMLGITSRPQSQALPDDKDTMVKQNQELGQNPGHSCPPNSCFWRSSNVQCWEIKMNMRYTVKASLFVLAVSANAASFF